MSRYKKLMNKLKFYYPLSIPFQALNPAQGFVLDKGWARS